jgi:trehalose 6-phosphate phosphatase
MKDILSVDNLPLLAHLAWSNVLLGFHFDGTLAPIVDDPDYACMRRRTRRLLKRIARAYPCVVVSGRGQSDLLPRLEGAKVFEAIGNHGLEPWHVPEPYARRVLSWVPTLRLRLAHLEGVVVEDKALSVAVHYRRAPRREQARAAIVEAAKELDGVRLLGGNCAVNLLPSDAPHKGIAVLAAREFLSCAAALYVGGDDTDEDVFALDEPGRLFTIRVEPSKASSAAFFVSDQRSVDTLLARLLALRTTGPGRH